MRTDMHELIQRHLAGHTTAEESEALQAALKADATLRALLLDYANLDVALGGLAESERAEPPRIVRWQVWRPLAAAAACVFGLLIFSRRPARPQPELTEVFATTESAIAHMPEPSLDPLPEWMSPTASMLPSSDFLSSTF
ncbi:hypothetical protein [Prosthecobacter sp.]|uniref:hypothetical protein n=1 Tax=Prosthecobacter sp. TaxID=1965333 RepID=UPI003784A8E7